MDVRCDEVRRCDTFHWFSHYQKLNNSSKYRSYMMSFLFLVHVLICVVAVVISSSSSSSSSEENPLPPGGVAVGPGDSD